MRAQVVPFSSVVGSSVTLHDDDGRVVGQLVLLNTGGDTHDAWKAGQTAIAGSVAAAINAAPTARQEAIEEAAKVAERDDRSPLAKAQGYEPDWYVHAKRIAAAIRSLNEPVSP